jgi:Uma2 family endonuclease
MYAFQQHSNPAAEAYLAREREAETRSEFIDGQIVAMAGASKEHNTVATNLMGLVYLALRGSERQTFGSDMRVITASENYCYPDLTIVCGNPELTDQRGDVLLNPRVIFEILSPGTESLDRGEKLRSYQRTPSIQEIVLISPNRVRVEQYTRQNEPLWLYRACEDITGMLALTSCGIEVPLAALYERLELVLPS